MFNPNQDQKDFLAKIGWVVECESPLEIRHQDGGFATGLAASYTIEAILNEYSERANELEVPTGKVTLKDLEDFFLISQHEKFKKMHVFMPGAPSHRMHLTNVLAVVDVKLGKVLYSYANGLKNFIDQDFLRDGWISSARLSHD